MKFISAIALSVPALLAFAAFHPAFAADQPLVNVLFDDQPIPASDQFFGAPQTYAFYSPDGEAIRLKIDNKAASREAELLLVSEDGSTIHTQFLPPGVNELEIKVPAPGVYFLKYDNGLFFWQLHIPEGTVASLCLEPGKPIIHSGTFYRRYFYVPKGTTQIDLKATAGHATYKLDIVNPDGVAEKTITESDEAEEFAIPVPGGMDGRVWMLDGSRFAPRQLAFGNLPNYLAAAPNALLLPADVVKKDGL